MKEVFLKRIDIAIRKAETSAGFSFPTKVLANITETTVPEIARVPGIATFEGRLPIITVSSVQMGSIDV